jgi:hypothetical protein
MRNLCGLVFRNGHPRGTNCASFSYQSTTGFEIFLSDLSPTPSNFPIDLFDIEIIEPSKVLIVKEIHSSLIQLSLFLQ